MEYLTFEDQVSRYSQENDPCASTREKSAPCSLCKQNREELLVYLQ